MAVDIKKLVTVEQLGGLATRVVNALAPTIKSAKLEGSTVSFYTSSDTTGTAAFTFDFPEEIFLDQASTTLVEDFKWTAEAYPGSTNPNLEGKVVLVLGVKGDKATNPTTKFSFVDLQKLVDTYTASDSSVAFSGHAVKVNISAAADNSLTLKTDGLHVDISGKIDKASGATAGNVPILTSDGGLSDSTYGIATNAEVTTMLDEILPMASGS